MKKSLRFLFALSALALSSQMSALASQGYVDEEESQTSPVPAPPVPTACDPVALKAAKAVDAENGGSGSIRAEQPAFGLDPYGNRVYYFSGNSHWYIVWTKLQDARPEACAVTQLKVN